jgi:phosphoglycolate phosphatase
MNKQYELLIFDWDGTLMDSERKIVNCFQAALCDVGLRPIDDDRIRGIIGLGLKEAMEELLPGEDEITRTKVSDAYREHFLVKDQTEMPMFPGVVDGIKHLSNRFKLAVATGKARRGLNRVLNGHELEHMFQVTRCADEAISKPHPLMLEQILQVTGIDADRALMVGDSTFDLQMANNVGMDALAVSYGVQTCDRLLEHKPIGCIHEFDEIHQWLS